MDTSKEKDEQRAKFLAFLLRCDLRKECTPEDLSSACVAFSVTPAEIRRLCALPNAALQLLNDRTVAVSQSFDLGIEKSFVSKSFVSLLNNQRNPPADLAKLGLVPPSGNVDARIVKLGSEPEPTVARSNFDGPNAVTQEQTVTEIRPPSTVLFPPGNGLATAAACVVEAKKKSKYPRSAPRFEDYAVDCEVGAGGYGTVYKVQRRADGQVFAIKCPLENTHDSCVRNEINMLKRLRGKDNIIQFKCEVMGKVSRTPEVGGEDVDCPSILLEFIEHEKPEVLKKEITIDELKCYSSSLFKALAQLHKERILHLDVKPGNFLFSRSTKRGCLVDFNLARDESAKCLRARYSTGRPERGPSRAGNNDGERKKRSLLKEEQVLPVSKRCRNMVKFFPNISLGTPPYVGDQNKERLKPAASNHVPVASPKDQQLPQSRSIPATGAITASTKHAEPLKVNDCVVDTNSAQQLGKPKTQPTVICGPKPLTGKHRIVKFYNENICGSTLTSSALSFTQTIGVPALKPNPNKRVPAGVPPHPQAMAQACTVKRAKPALKVKAPCQPVKDGPCVGTKGYRAPEVLMRSTKQTTKVDIWSAGVSLLQLVTGRSPFPSSSTDGSLRDIAKLRGSATMDKLAKSLGQRLRFLKESHQGMPVKEWSEKYSRRTDLKGRVPSTLYDLIERCLEVNPDSRITAEGALQHHFFSTDSETSAF